MEATMNEFKHLSVNSLIDLLLAKASELVKASDSSDRQIIERLTREMQAIHQLIKEKRNEEGQ